MTRNVVYLRSMIPSLSLKRRARFACLTAGAVLLATRLLTVAPAWADEPATRPNVIFIVLDASRADHFSGYGYPKDTTPRMDRLAAEGAVFLNNFSQGSDTQTSLPRILSSRHYSLKIFQEDRLSWGLRQRTPETVSKVHDAEQAFLPEMLSAAGYRTAIVTDHHWIIPGTELAGMFDEIFYFKRQDSFDSLLRSATRWIQQHAAAGMPFLLYVHITAPHSPFPSSTVDPRFLDGYPPERVDAIRLRLENLPSGRSDGWSDEELGIYRALYDGKLRRADGVVGNILDAADVAGLKANSLVVVTGDHGENLGEHQHLDHGGMFWDSVTHVPLILTMPGAIPAGRRIAALTESVDIVPTILELCGLSPPAGKSMDGVSLTDLLPETAQGRDASISSDFIRTETRKYYPKERFLTDLQADPGELHDIAAREPETVASLLREWERRIDPFRRRYEESVSNSPQRFPFYFSVDKMRLETADPVQFTRGGRRLDLPQLVEGATQAWLLNSSSIMDPALFALPGRARSGPLALSAPVPKGDYRVSLAVVSPEASTATLPAVGYRFSAGDEFQTFEDIAPVGRHWRETGMNLFLYRTRGWLRADEGFRIELSLPTTLPNFWGVTHVRFEPRSASKLPTPPPGGDAEFRRLMRQRGYW